MKVSLSYCYIKEILAEGASVSERGMLLLSPNFFVITFCSHGFGL